jgi:hypothetical protein
MGGDTGSDSDGSYGITASLFRWDGSIIMDKYNFDNDSSEVRNYMLMGCWHKIVTHSDGVKWPRLAQPLNGWEFPVTSGITYPDTLGTDTCGDNIYDGVYETVGRLWPQRMGLDTESTNTHGPKFEWLLDVGVGVANTWYHRKIPELCDNGGNLMAEYAHGCDRLCQPMTGWTCYHYFKEFEASPHYEVPVYASKCENDDEIAATPSILRRRLEETSKANYARALKGLAGRRLDHLDQKTFAQALPTNTFAFAMNHLVLHPKVGLNGQVRILENPYTTDGSSGTGDYSLFGLMYGQQYDSATQNFVTVQV